VNGELRILGGSMTFTACSGTI